jgi:hypothetical protein
MLPSWAGRPPAAAGGFRLGCGREQSGHQPQDPKVLGLIVPFPLIGRADEVIK